jgi:enterobactin synthetase component D
LTNILSPFGDGFGFSMKTLHDYAGVTLYPQEIALLSPGAVQKHKVEFCLGRAAAHSALREINVCNFPVLKGINNEPLWPRGVVGAISHCGEIALAAVALKEIAAGVGIDIEIMDETIFEDIVKGVCTIREFVWVNERNGEKLERLLMIFSAKESIFKAFFPIANVFLDFLDAELTWNDDTGSFSGKLLKSAGKDYDKGYIFEVGCKTIDKYIFTFMNLPPTGMGNIEKNRD